MLVVAVAELAVEIDAPAQDPAVVVSRQREEPAGRRRRDLHPGGQVNLEPASHGSLRGAIAELAVRVEAPGQQPPDRGDRVSPAWCPPRWK